MGAFSDYIAEVKGSVAGPIVLGGTIFPFSDFTIVPAFLMRGATFPVPTIDVLLDLPYDMLVLDMEVVVSAVDLTPRKRYRLIQLPPAGQRLSEMGAINLSDYWEEALTGAGEPGDDGLNGDRGWCPVLANEEDGPTRVVQKLVDWVNGEGEKPAVPNPAYIGTTGYVAKSSAINIKGPAGIDAVATAVRPQVALMSGGEGFGGGLTPPEIPSAETKVQEVTIANTWTGPRSFLVVGSCSFKEAGGYVFPEIKVRYKQSNAAVGTSDAIIAACMSRVDIGDNPPGGYHQLSVHHIITIPAGVTWRAALTVQARYGEGGRRSEGKLIAIGL